MSSYLSRLSHRTPQQLLFTIALLLCVICDGSEGRPPEAGLADIWGDFLSFNEDSCDGTFQLVPGGGASAATYKAPLYKSMFAPLGRCFSPEMFARDSPLASSAVECPTALMNVSLASPCKEIAESVIVVMFCRFGHGLPVGASSTGAVSREVGSAFNTTEVASFLSNEATCIDGEYGRSLLSAAFNLATMTAISEMRFEPACYPPRIIPCQSDSATSSLGILIGNVTGGSSNSSSAPLGLQGCSDVHWRLVCSYCQPYIVRDAIAQPYYFLIFPGIKMVLVVCLQLYVIDRLANRIRRRCERFERERPVPPITDDIRDFSRLVYKQILKEGRYRIRLRLTMRNIDGRSTIVTLMKRLKDYLAKDPHNKQEDAVIVSSDEEWKKLTDTHTGVALQGALFPREVVVSILHEHLVENCEKYFSTADMDWFWQKVSRCGERVYNGPVTTLQGLFKSTWRLQQLPQVLEHEQHGTRNLDDDVHVLVRVVGQENEVEVKKVYIVSCETESSVVEVLQCIRHMMSNDGLDTTLFSLFSFTGERAPVSELVSQVPSSSSSVAASTSAALHSSLQSEKNLPAELKIEALQKWVHQRLGEHYDGKIDRRFIPLRALLGPNCVTADTESTAVGEHAGSIKPEGFLPILQQIHDLRDQFLQNAEHSGHFEMPKFDQDGLLAETQENLSKLLDARLQSSISAKLLVLTGDEVAYDYLLTKQYGIRDSIPQLACASVPAGASPNPKVKKGRSAKRAQSFTRQRQQDGAAPDEATQANESPSTKEDLHEKQKEKQKSDSLGCFECFFGTPNHDQPAADSHEPIVHPSSHVSDGGNRIDDDGERKDDGGREVAPQGCEWELRQRNMQRTLRVMPPKSPFYSATAAEPQKEAAVEPEVSSAAVHPETVRTLYVEAYEEIVSRKDCRGDNMRVVLRSYPNERKPLEETLSQMYNVIEAQLVAAHGDPYLVSIPHIVSEFREKVEMYSRIVPIVTKEQQVFMTVYAVNPWILLMQVIYGLIFFTLSVIEARRQVAVVEGAAIQSSSLNWTVYQLAMFRFLNSGSPASLLNASMANLLSGEEQRSKSYFFRIVHYGAAIAAVLLIAPALVTHLLPGALLYLWVLVIITVACAVPSVVLTYIYFSFERKWSKKTLTFSEWAATTIRAVHSIDDDDVNDEAASKIIAENNAYLRRWLTALVLWFQFSVVVLLAVLSSTCFNWALLFFEGEHSYMGVFDFELEARSSACYIEQALGNPSNVAQLFSNFVG